ncbi:MAG: NAD-dependent deacetylase [Acidimicrobiia bacterium]|nr:NAD-dependent deacetylase [Acidimicrobiia bacterium]
MRNDHWEVDAAAELLAGRSKILVFTGAGISTASGIPDFRGPDGVWTKIDPAEFTYDRYVSRADTRIQSWQMRFASGVLDAEPNDGHRAVKQLWDSGLMIGCVTQNIDGLHALSGLPSSALVEVHGSAHGVRCLSCDDHPQLIEVKQRWESGEADPKCERCGGILKSTVISFGEAMPQKELTIAYDWAESADAVIAVGSTLSVYPAADVPATAARRGQPYLIVNRGITDHDRAADLKIEGDAGEVMRGLVHRLSAID